MALYREMKQKLLEKEQAPPQPMPKIKSVPDEFVNWTKDGDASFAAKKKPRHSAPERRPLDRRPVDPPLAEDPPVDLVEDPPVDLVEDPPIGLPARPAPERQVIVPYVLPNLNAIFPPNMTNDDYNCFVNSVLQMLAAIPFTHLPAVQAELAMANTPFITYFLKIMRALTIISRGPRIPISDTSGLVNSWNQSEEQINTTEFGDPAHTAALFLTYLMRHSPTMAEHFAGSTSTNTNITQENPLFLNVPYVDNYDVSLADRLNMMYEGYMVDGEFTPGEIITDIHDVVFVRFNIPTDIDVPKIFKFTEGGDNFYCRSVVCYANNHFVTYVVRRYMSILCDDTGPDNTVLVQPADLTAVNHDVPILDKHAQGIHIRDAYDEEYGEGMARGEKKNGGAAKKPAKKPAKKQVEEQVEEPAKLRGPPGSGICIIAYSR